MTEPKEHHFVPQFYLKKFGEGKSIRLFNFERRRHIPGAPIKSQCARHKLHAFSPGLEQKLSVLEGAAANAIRSILDEGAAPVARSETWQDALGFLVLQKMRTARSMQSVDTLADFMLAHAPEPGAAVEGPDREQLKAAMGHPLALLFQFLGEVLGHATDLGMHLLVNGTTEGFITCDDPVVFHNQYCEGIDHHGVLGWLNTGLQAFLPLSPNAVLVLYDQTVYKVAGTRQGSTASTLTDVRHVRQINELQFLNAVENVYYKGEPTEAFQGICEAMVGKRVGGRIALVETEPAARPDGTSSQLLHTFEPLLPVRLSLPQMEIRRRARRIPLEVRGRTYRNGTVAGSARGHAQTYRVQNITHR
ncbi:DUF4238 domain-containing protein [Luteibacter jiangsuensis]|uniref:DUF4238 domain-containing protein n=1 Tax=Luteibacter jiangsuensis TaxID=637577 RepID=A0ABX0Q8E6_9GAMM|nr:DUF4238 domain-containing protein [Luteibacter jiangsuensis]NID05892.1 DUF4238 domain-containing protein [Luteibacter jiangsuensis]